MKIIKECLSVALFKTRLNKGFSQERMAEYCCISPREYCDLENGKRLPSLMTLVDMSIICEIDINTIINEAKKKGYISKRWK